MLIPDPTTTMSTAIAEAPGSATCNADCTTATADPATCASMTAATVAPAPASSLDTIPDPLPDGTALAAACFPFYRARGFALCRIPTGHKNPVESCWQLNPVLDADEFRVGDAIGLILGPLSGGLFAIDLDFHAEDADAWAAADALLPATGLVDGRPGKLTCHRVYRLADTEWADSVLPRTGCTTRQAMDEGFLPRFPGTRHFSNGQGRAIDALGAGSQLVIPPSLHPSGVRRIWWTDMPGEPATVAYADLMAAVAALVDQLGLRRQRAAAPEDAPEPPDPASIAQVAEPERIQRLQGYLASAPPLEHNKHQGFHGQQWRIACVCAEFAVPREAAEPLYLAWNRKSATPDDDASNASTLEKAYRSAVFGSRLVEPEAVDLSHLLPVLSPAREVAATVEQPPMLALRTHADRLRDAAHPRPKVIAGLLPAGGLGAVVAMPGVGKTLVAVELARCIASGEPFAGRAVAQGRVIYACTDSQRSTENRLVVLPPDAAEQVFSIGSLSLPQDFNALHQSCLVHTPTLLILDTWDSTRSHAAAGGWAEQDAALEHILRCLRYLADHHGLAAVIVHHATRVDHGRPRGSVVFDARADWIGIVQGDEQRVSLQSIKCRDGACGPVGSWRIDTRPLHDENIPVLVEGAAAEQQQPVPADDLDQRILDALGDAAPEGGWSMGKLAAALGMSKGKRLQGALTALRLTGRIHDWSPQPLAEPIAAYAEMPRERG